MASAWRASLAVMTLPEGGDGCGILFFPKLIIWNSYETCKCVAELLSHGNGQWLAAIMAIRKLPSALILIL